MSNFRIPTRAEANETVRERTLDPFQKLIIQTMIDDFNGALENGACVEKNGEMQLGFKLSIPPMGVALSDNIWTQTRDNAYSEFKRMLLVEGFDVKTWQWTTAREASVSITWKV